MCAGETGKARQRRLETGWFDKYAPESVVGIDIGCQKDPLNRTYRRWDFIFEDGDAEEMAGLDEDMFQTVYAYHVLEHIDNPIKAIKNWFRITRSGGHLIIGVPHRDLYEKKIAPPSNWNHEHKWFWLPEEHDLENQTFGLYGTMKVRLNNIESISPNVFLGNTRFQDRIIDSLKYSGASNISFGINYLTPIWGLNFRYIKGATFFIDQNTFIFPDTRISNETLFLRASYTKEIPSRNLKFHGFANYFLRMPKNVQNLGLSSRMDFQIIRRLNGFAMFNFFTNSMSNQEDGTSSSRFFNLNLGLTYNVDLPQPKIKYHNLKVVCFQDLNGDQIKSENEPAIPNIILKISRDFESDFLNTLFYEKELISNSKGEISLNDLPEGDFFLNFRSIANLGILYNTNGNEQELSLQSDYTLFVPYGEGYKVSGQVQITRDVNTDKGTVKPSSIRVEAISVTGEVFTALTDENGSYSISVPHPGYYKVSLNNVFGNDFYIKNNKMVIQFDGFKLFKLDFEVVEKNRKVNIKGNSQFKFGNK